LNMGVADAMEATNEHSNYWYETPSRGACNIDAMHRRIYNK